MGIGAAAVLAAGILAVGCSDDSGGDTIVVGGGGSTLPTRADQVSSTMESNWADNEESVNRGNTDDNDLYVRVLRLRDNSGIMVWNAGDDGDEQLWVAHFPATGGIEEPHNIVSDAVTYGTDAVESFVMAAAPDGSIAMGFIATQDNNVTNVNDVQSDRVYVGSWSQQGGFTTFSAIDSNSVTTDDNGVNTLFVISNSRDATQRFDSGDFPDSNIDLYPTGFADSAQANPPMIFFGWTHANSTGNTEIEGAFWELDDLATLPTNADVIDIDLPGVASTENVFDLVYTSGTEALFFAQDTGGTNDQEAFLVRMDPVAGDVEDTILLTRGASTADVTLDTDGAVLIGQGFQPLNGQDATWVVLSETGFTSTSNADTDLVIYQVDNTGAFEVDEFDHNALNATNANGVSNVTVQPNRGMSGVFLYYTAATDTTTNTSTSLFARALRLNADEALADNVSNEEQLNASVSTDLEASVLEYYVASIDPFCSPDVDNGADYVVFRQGIDNDDLVELNGVLVEVDDPTVSPITITASAEDSIATTDNGWSTSLSGDWPVIVTESNSEDGGLVFFVDQGNAKGDDSTANSFEELQLFAFAPALNTGQVVDALPATIINSHSDDLNLAFPDWQQLTDSVEEFQAITVPVRAASRDFASWGADSNGNITIAADELTPTHAYVVFPEYVGTNDGDGDESYFARVVDLSASNFADPEDRFTPALTAEPARVGQDSGQFEDISGDITLFLLPQDSDAVVVFNQNTSNDGSGSTEGRVYINVITPTGVAAEPALMSNDEPYGIYDFGDGLFDFDGDQTQWSVTPAAACDQAVGGRYVQVRHIEDFYTNEYRTTIQSRQILSKSLRN